MEVYAVLVMDEILHETEITIISVEEISQALHFIW